MRQVPTRYLIIGNGCVAKHFYYYLTLLNLNVCLWQRTDSFKKLSLFQKAVSHILILTKDAVIEPFIIEHLQNSEAYLIHFSGSLVTNHAYGAHPLMSFNENFYSIAEYKKIPFIIDDDAPDWENFLPGLSNQHVRLDKSLKAKYHALCVLGGNFSTMLWQKLFYDFEHDLQIPSTLAHFYLLKQTENLILNPKTALTGPLVRKDQTTINNNLNALHSDPFKEVYQSFVDCYQKMKNNEII